MTFSIGGTAVITSDRIVRLTTGATASRPAAGSRVPGQLFFDTTLNKVIVWDGAAWREAPSTNQEVQSLWAWGKNTYGQLGDNTIENRSSPVSVVSGFTDWVQISGGFGGNNSAAAIRGNGTLWMWGDNIRGQLGNSSGIGAFSSPVSVVGGFTDWKQVAAGSRVTIGLRTNGTIWTWGRNDLGQLGNNNSTSQNTSSPISIVGGITDWIQVSARGSYGAIAIRSNGTAWGWGSQSYTGNHGSIGDGTIIDRSSPVSVVGGFTDWVQVAGANIHTAGVRANGTAWCWGRADSGRLGNGQDTVSTSSPVSVVGGFTDWIQIDCGQNHTAAVRSNGTAWTWGWNFYGELGIDSKVSASSPVQVVGGFTDWVQITAGNANISAIRANGTAWGWGRALSSGNNVLNDKSSPVQVVGGFTDWVQISTGSDVNIGLRSQPLQRISRIGRQG